MFYTGSNMYFAVDNFYQFFFQPSTSPWYTGNVWGNMVAWVVCGVITIVWARAKFIKWNRHREEQDAIRHEQLKVHINDHMERLHAKLKELQ